MDEKTIARFWKRVDKRGPDECWPWLGSARKALGYGNFSIGKRGNYTAHRIAFCIAHGLGARDIPGVCILHSCDNPVCCNPRHLSRGTHLRNAIEREERGRGRPMRGEAHYAAKLTESSVRELRHAFHSGESQSSLARRFGVGQATVSRAVIGRAWKHVR